MNQTLEKPVQTFLGIAVSNQENISENAVGKSFSASDGKLSTVPKQFLPYVIKPGECRNPSGRPKNVFNLQARAKELGPKVFDLLTQWAQSDDFRAALPAIRMILATGFPEFEKAVPLVGDVPPGFENLSAVERIRELNKRREEMKRVQLQVEAERKGAPAAALPAAAQTPPTMVRPNSSEAARPPAPAVAPAKLNTRKRSK